MERKIVIFDVDDVHPEEGYGLKKDNSDLKYIKNLNKMFGLKATLFVPLNWHGKYPIGEDKQWWGWLRRFQNHGHEIAAHGITHSTPDPRAGVREFTTMNEEQTVQALEFLKSTWVKLGVDIEGIRYPGWGETKFTEKHTGRYFKYVASHILGEKPIPGYNKLFRVPYNLNINNLYDVGQSIYILHSHIGTDKKTENLLTYENYLKIVDFLKELESKYDIKYMTFKEYISHLKIE